MQRSNLLGLLVGTALAVLLAGCGTAEHTAAEPEPSTPESAVQTVEKEPVQEINGIVCTGNATSSAAVQVLDDYYARNPDADKIYLVCIDTPEDVMQGIEKGIVYGTIAQNIFAHGYIPLVILNMMGTEGYKQVEGTYFIDSGCVLVTKDNMDNFQADLQAVTDQIIEELPVKYLTK